MRTSTLLLLACSPLLAACPGDPPPGLLDALRVALMGQARGCPTLSCPRVGVGSWSHGDAPDAVVAATQAVATGWCPTWNARIGATIDENTTRGMRTLENTVLNVSGFGSVTLKSTDLRAEIRARSDGYQVFLEHPNHLTGGTGQCPRTWVSDTCRYIPEVTITTAGAIGASWVSGTDRVSGSLSIGESFDWDPGTEQSWCATEFHPGVRPAWHPDGTPDDSTVTDPTQLTCSPVAHDTTADTGAETCESHADCPSDACAERWCDPSGTCAEAAAPDGTTCPGGTCQDGACTP